MQANRVALFLLLFFAVLMLCHAGFTVSEAAPSSGGEVVLDAESGRVLAERNAEKRMPMASTTKILTAIIVLEECDLAAVVSVPSEAAGTEGSSIYLSAGEKITVLDLLYGLMLRSGNDCAATLAIHHSGSISAFAEYMNAFARKIGVTESHFANPHGLPAEDHYTTPKDLANIAAYALQNQAFCEIVSCKEWKTGAGSEVARVFCNKNKMLYQYEGACGIKTGYTKEAGRCLVTAAQKEGMRLVCVVLNSPSMYERSAELLDAAFAKFDRVCLFKAAEFAVRISAGTGGKRCTCLCKKDFYYPLSDAEFDDIRVEKSLPQALSLPIKKGDEVGEVRIYLKNQLLFSQKIVSIEEIKISFSDILREIAKSGRGNGCASINILQPAA